MKIKMNAKKFQPKISLEIVTFASCVYFWVYVFASVCMPHACRCPLRPKEGFESPRAEVSGSCELSSSVLGIELWSSGGTRYSQSLSISLAAQM